MEDHSPHGAQRAVHLALPLPGLGDLQHMGDGDNIEPDLVGVPFDQERSSVRRNTCESEARSPGTVYRRPSSSDCSMMFDDEEVGVVQMMGGFELECELSVFVDEAAETSAEVGRSLTEMVTKLTTFSAEEANLLRATDLSTLLDGMGAIFRNSAGSSHTHAMSMAVAWIDAFVSHNWSSPRYQKFFVLALHFNLRRALVVASLCALAIGAATGAGALPLSDHTTWRGCPVGFMCKVVFTPTFLAVLFFGRSCGRRCGARNPKVFLDKVCIHQTDPVLMRKGIHKLAAFLCSSELFVVLYSDVYLNKLWTVFELAAFMAACQHDKLRLLPIRLGRMITFGMGSVWCAQVLGIALQWGARIMFTHQIVAIVAMISVVPCIHLETKTEGRIRRQLANFSVRSCVCAVESDRPLVYEHIGRLVRHYGLAARTANEEEALDSFDTFVRQELPNMFASQRYVSQLLRYRFVVATAAQLAVPVYMDQMYCFMSSPCSVLAHFLEGAAILFCIAPMWGFLTEAMIRRHAELRGVWDFIWATFSAAVTGSVGLMAVLGLQILTQLMKTGEPVYGAAYCAVILSLAVFTIMVYWPHFLNSFLAIFVG